MTIPSNNLSAIEAYNRLKEGNNRFATGVRSVESMLSLLRRQDLVEKQTPFAVILGCSDSRVPVEMIFDQGLGDLFVIRVAGNIVAPSLVGSVEFAAERFGSRLVVVLGHTNCGAIEATIEYLGQKKHETQASNKFSIVERIVPAARSLMKTDLNENPEDLRKEITRLNVSNTANHLRHASDILEGLIEKDGLRVIGAEYCLHTGIVDFFDDVETK